MKEITDALTDIHTKLGDIRESQVRQEEQHKSFGSRLTEVESDLDPVKNHVQQMRGAGKLVAIVGTLVGIVAVIIAYT